MNVNKNVTCKDLWDGDIVPQGNFSALNAYISKEETLKEKKKVRSRYSSQ